MEREADFQGDDGGGAVMLNSCRMSAATGVNVDTLLVLLQRQHVDDEMDGVWFEPT